MQRKNVFIGTGLVLAGLVAGLALSPVVRATSQAPFSATFPLLQQVYQTIVQDYYVPVNQSSLVQGAIGGLTGALNDPYTVYYTPAEYQQFTQEVNGQYAGIGAELDTTAQGVEVMTVFPNTPAAKAGVQSGDIFRMVNGQSVVHDTPTQVANAVRGQAGSVVKIEFQRGAKTYTASITRAMITIPTATEQLLPGHIGLITLSQFSSDAGAAFQSALSALQKDNPRGYILDLRNNPGGYVDQAVQIAQDIVPKGTIATLEGKNFPAQIYTSASGKSLGVPLIILVNGGTASAAEILSAAIAQNHEGTLYGTQTFGKGIAQDVVPMQGGGYLKITVAQWMTPDGGNIEHKGIAPNYVVTGPATLIAAEAALGGQRTMVSNVTVGSKWVTAGKQSSALGHAPVMQDGQLYLSPTAVEAATGAQVVYIASNSTFEVTLGQHTLTMPLGNTQGTLDTKTVRIVPAITIKGMQYVPAADLQSAFHIAFRSLGGGSYQFTTTY
ncbi:MAG: S41 family peptidase [Thermaerobacter sp.]|nr:S41 family peptidase [Thermaerobacter sp.]